MSDDLEARLAAAGRAAESVDERRRAAAIHARLFGVAPPVTVGRYRIISRLGAGAMGTVFAAHDDRLDRPVAVKVLTERGERARTLLLREARGLARVTHPNTVTIYGADTEGDRVFIVMERLSGETLAEWSRGRPWQAIMRAYRAAGRGLAAVHGCGMVHRDFKPSNVIVTDDGRVQVVDFGLARGVDEVAGGGSPREAPALSLTHTGALVGTPAYMAPELLAGERASPATDQFAFCVALFEGLCGQRPFAGETLEAIATQIDAGPGALRGVPRRVAAVIERGLRRDPEARWPDMDALLAALERATHTRRWGWLGLAALVVGAGLAWAAGRSSAPPNEPIAAQPAARGLPARSDRAAAVLAARRADAGWRAQARALLDRPIRERALGQLPGVVVESYWLDGDTFWARTSDQALWLWTGAGFEGTTLRALGRRCDAFATRWHESLDASGAACHQAGRLDLADGVLRFTDAAGRVGPPITVEHPWYASADQLYRLDGAGGIDRTPLMGGETEAPPELRRMTRFAIASGSALVRVADGTIWLWRERSMPRRLGRFGKRVRLRLGLDGESAAVVDRQRVYVWPNDAAEPFELPGTWADGVDFDRSGRWLVAHRDAHGFTLWDLVERRAHEAVVPSGDLMLVGFAGPDVISAHRDGHVARWRIGAITGEWIGMHPGRIWAGALSPSRTRWVTTGLDHTAQLGTLGGDVRVLRGHGRGVMSATFSPTEDRLATGAADGTARVWSLDGRLRTVLPGHETWAYALGFSDDGADLATASKAGVVRLWPGARPPARIIGRPEPGVRMNRIHSLSFTAEGAVVAGIKAGAVTAWSTQGDPPHALPRHRLDPNVVRAPDGAILTWGGDAEVRVWDSTDWRLREVVRVPGGVRTVAAGAGGVIGGSTFAGAVWWRPEGGAPRILAEGFGTVEFVAFDAEGARLIAGNAAGAVSVWRLADGQARRLRGHHAAVRFVGFDARGDAISAGENGLVLRWALGTDEAALRARLEAATAWCLTAEERATWLDADEAAAVDCLPQEVLPQKVLPQKVPPSPAE